MTSFTTGMLYLCRVCVLPSLLNTVMLLFKLVENFGRLIHGNAKKWLFFFTAKWGGGGGGRLIHDVNLYTAKYGIY